MAVLARDSDSESDSLLKMINMPQAGIDERRHIKYFDDLKQQILMNGVGSPSSSPSRSRSPAGVRPSGSAQSSTGRDFRAEFDRLCQQVECQLARVEDHLCIKAFTQVDLELSEDDLFYRCNNRVDSILSRNVDRKYYLGVTENPLRRWQDP